MLAQSLMNKSKPEDLFNLSSPGKYFCIAIALAHPISRGHLHIRSADPADMLMIDLKYLVHPLDLEICSHYVRFINGIATTELFSNFLKPNGMRLPEWASTETFEVAKRLVKDHSMSNSTHARLAP